MSRRTRDVASALAVVVLFSLPLLAEILGSRLLVFRDAQVTHWPWRRAAVHALAQDRVPYVNEAASGGEPLLANPNAVLLYPTFLFEKVFSPEAAFNLHYLVHVVWAFLGARLLARRLGLGPGGALMAGVAYGFSGMMLSYGSAFMNSSAAAAWAPWCAAAFLAVADAPAGRGLARPATALGLALGLQLLAGEPAISLLTLALGSVLLLVRAAAAPRAQRMRRLARGFGASAAAGLFALAFAAPLLLPLSAVFPMTYRGLHLYSEKASGAAAFSPGRAIEWLLPRFGGSPEQLGGGANWLRAISGQDFVYIWSVTFGVVPLLVLVLAAVRGDFWKNGRPALAATAAVGLLFSFGFSLPFYRLVFAVPALRKLRYPIKFYLLTTLAVALLSGFAAESAGRRRLGRREAAVIAAALAAFAAAWMIAAPGGALERWAAPVADRVAADPAAFLAVFRRLVRGDALIGAGSVLVVGLLLRRGAASRADLSPVLALLALVTGFSWGLPLFVSAPARELVQPPALALRLGGPGRVYVSRDLPRFDVDAARKGPGDELARSSRVARIVAEQLVPLTGAPFGVRYLFENDPDGSYGFFNRLASEAADASTPAQRDRLLRLYGARWTLAPDGETHPLFRPLTGLEIAGRRLLLSETPDPVPELRWAGRVWRRPALSATIELVRSEAFDPGGDVALPGRRPEDPSGPGAAARLTEAAIEPDRAGVTVEAQGDGHVLFARTFFPSWRATVDGEAAPVSVANARDLAVAVPRGRHRVEIAYDATPFRRGVALQAAALLLAVLGALAGRRQPQVHEQQLVDVRPAAV